MLEFTKETNIGEVVMMAPQVTPLFEAIGMHCFMCSLASAETIEEACLVHGVDPDEFIEELNYTIAQIEKENE